MVSNDHYGLELQKQMDNIMDRLHEALTEVHQRPLATSPVIDRVRKSMVCAAAVTHEPTQGTNGVMVEWVWELSNGWRLSFSVLVSEHL